MKKSLALALTAALCIACPGNTLSEDEFTGGGVYVSPIFVQGIYRLEKPGSYIVGNDCIPSGVYELTTDCFSGEVYLSDGYLLTVSQESSVTLRPVNDSVSADAQPFTAYDGRYTVGEDFPAGKYVLKSVDLISFVRIYEHSLNPSPDNPDWTFPEWETVTIDSDDENYFCDLKDGNVLDIDGAVRFVPTANGILYE